MATDHQKNYAGYRKKFIEAHKAGDFEQSKKYMDKCLKIILRELEMECNKNRSQSENGD